MLFAHAGAILVFAGELGREAMAGGEQYDWRSMDTAPKDGTTVLGRVRASEQGPAEMDVVRWAMRDERWIAADSDPGCIIVYADAELTGWLPLPARLPKLRAADAAGTRVRGRFSDEIEGSGI